MIIAKKKLPLFMPWLYAALSSILAAWSASAQRDELRFEHLTSNRGLTHSTVNCILQDSRGFLWFGTEDGLHRYDGYGFTVYRRDKSDRYSLSDNFVYALCEDENGTLWVGTNSGGLNAFNRRTEQFTRYEHDPANPNSLGENNVRALLLDGKGILWVGTYSEGLHAFDTRSQKFTRFKIDPGRPASSASNHIRAIVEDHNGQLWIGTKAGLHKFNRETHQFTQYEHQPNNSNSLSSNNAFAIFQDRAGILWIGTDRGLNRFDPEKQQFTRYAHRPGTPHSLVDNIVHSIIEDRSGTLWIGTDGGLSQFKRDRGFLINFKHDPSNLTGLSSNQVWSLSEDRSGVIWIGTANGGINKFETKQKNFTHYRRDPNNLNSLSHNTLRSIYEDAAGILWIGTLGGGLNKFDRRSNRFTHYKYHPDDPTSLSNDVVTSIFQDERSELWVGTWGGGVNRLTLPEHGRSQASSTPATVNQRVKFIRYQHDPSNASSLSGNIVLAIYGDAKGSLWIATGIGLDLFDRQRNRFIHFQHDPDKPKSLSDNRIQSSCILEDRSGNLWIGTWDGLNRAFAPNGTSGNFHRSLEFTRYKHDPGNPRSLSDNRVISMYEDLSGRLWIGTHGGGLNELVVKPARDGGQNEVEFVHYTEKDGLASDVIYGILGDDDGNLWMSTNNGLSKFDPKTRRFRNYYEIDGLQGNQFFWGASHKGRSGELYFGGTNGFTAFHPRQLKENTHIPAVAITKFEIFNKPVAIASEDSPLRQSIIETEQIELRYDQNVFSFEFTALDFSNPEHNQYAYMMEGFDRDWIYSGGRRFVSYTNLDYGDYVFRVKGSNNDGTWNEQGASLRLKILPPFWRTWWFLVMATLLLGALIASLITYRVRQMLAVERLRTKLAADLHDSIGSGLTEISILSEVIAKTLQHASHDVAISLAQISANCHSLIDNMSDIVWLVNPKRDSLYDLMLRLKDSYAESLSQAEIAFKSENLKSLEKVSLPMEYRQHLYLIFKEGINNSIKHAICTEMVLYARINGRRLQITLKDNGRGLPNLKEPYGNGLENMALRAKNIGGTLTIQSSPEEGTTVEFIGTIPRSSSG